MADQLILSFDSFSANFAVNRTLTGHIVKRRIDWRQPWSSLSYLLGISQDG